MVSNQWWAAVVSAKRLAPYYLDRLNEAGFHHGSVPLLQSVAWPRPSGDPAQAPWGGLPKPALLAARLTCDCIQRVFETWAATLGAELILLDAPGGYASAAALVGTEPSSLARTVRRTPAAVHGRQFERLIASLEKISGRRFDVDRLRSLMEQVNRQEEYFEEVREADL